MAERLEAINIYYIDLEYDDGFDEEENTASMKISTLVKEMEFTDVNDFSERFLKTVSVIEKNLSLFEAVCEHSDIITTIIEYLNYFGMKFKLGSNCDEEYEKDDIVFLVLFTILKACYDSKMRSFFRNAIIGKSALEKSIQYQYLRQMYHSHTIEIILLADSDLFAFITCFIENLDLSLDQLRVQEPIKEKVFWLLRKYTNYDFENIRNIILFRTKEELFTASTPDKMNIVSIWTEDIVFAKNLALSLNRDVLFINTYMDFYGSTVLLPFTKIFNKTVHKWCESNFNDSIKITSLQRRMPVYNSFCDGMWQLPINTYWIHEDRPWTNVTSDDIMMLKCINSAEKGCKIWSNKSVACRMQILSKFASMLECSGKSLLADVISKWINFSCIYEKSLSCVSQSGGLEVTKIRNPRGVIILKEENEAVLFRRLMQILTVGNSVIVICGPNSCLVPYCNMFLASEIPPGVINLLSRKDVKELELSLCGMDYESYAKQFFSEDDLEKTYINLTKPKHIIVSLKS